MPRVINVDKNAVYPLAVDKLKASKQLPNTSQLRQIKYLNNLVEQEHRFIKRLTKLGMGFGTFHSARRTLRGMEAMNMIRSRTDPQPQKRGHYGTDLFDQSSLRTSCLNFLLFLQYWLFCSLFATQPVLLKATLVNWYWYCPWFAMPPFYLIGRTNLMWGNSLAEPDCEDYPVSIHQKYWLEQYRDIYPVGLVEKDWREEIRRKIIDLQPAPVTAPKIKQLKIEGDLIQPDQPTKPKGYKRAKSRKKSKSLF